MENFKITYEFKVKFRTKQRSIKIEAIDETHAKCRFNIYAMANFNFKAEIKQVEVEKHG